MDWRRKSWFGALVGIPQLYLETILSHVAPPDEFREHAMLVGYARVSTREQNQALQLDALQAAGCERVYTEKASGANARDPSSRQRSTMPVRATRWWCGSSTGLPAQSGS